MTARPEQGPGYVPVARNQTASWQIALATAPGGINCGPAKRQWNRDLPVGLSHVLALEKLPLHHKDPFDRLLIVQANAENVGILSADAIFKQYEVNLPLNPHATALLNRARARTFHQVDTRPRCGATRPTMKPTVCSNSWSTASRGTWTRARTGNSTRRWATFPIPSATVA